MKKLHLIISFVLVQILILTSASAQKKNVVKFNLLSPIVKTLAFSYERDISDITSTQVEFSFVSLGVTGVKYSGYSITPEQRIYTAIFDAWKVYVAPFARYHNGNMEALALDAKATFTSYGGGVIFGGKYLLRDIAVLDVFLGPSYSSGDIDVINGADEHFVHLGLATELLTGLRFRAGIAIGLAF